MYHLRTGNSKLTLLPDRLLVKHEGLANETQVAYTSGGAVAGGRLSGDTVATLAELDAIVVPAGKFILVLVEAEGVTYQKTATSTKPFSIIDSDE